VFESVACAPAGAGVADGASCGDVATCAITCGATMGLSSGLPATCISACKADATSYGNATEVTPSELGLFHLDRFLECSQAECAAETTWQSYVSCATALCTDLAKYCYSTPS
jgi:hypothetical protein